MLRGMNIIMTKYNETDFFLSGVGGGGDCCFYGPFKIISLISSR